MKIKLSNKLLALFLMVSILPMAIVGWVTNQRTSNTIETMQYEKLNALAEDRANKVEQLFFERSHDAILLAQFPLIAQILNEYSNGFSARGIDSPAYAEIDRERGTYLSDYAAELKIYDQLLINAHGDIVFTTAKNSDLGTNLHTGPHKDSELAQVFQRAMAGETTKDVNIATYQASGVPTIFIAAPLEDTNGVVGAIAFEIPTKTLYAFAEDYIGLGETGETVLASLRGEEVLMVAPTRHDPAAALQRSVTMGSSNAKPIQEAANGKNGTGEFKDYRGKTVLAAWRYLPAMKLGMVLKIDRSEAMRPIYSLNLSLIHI